LSHSGGPHAAADAHRNRSVAASLTLHFMQRKCGRPSLDTAGESSHQGQAWYQQGLALKLYDSSEQNINGFLLIATERHLMVTRSDSVTVPILQFYGRW
jgi:hypothetical protein